MDKQFTRANGTKVSLCDISTIAAEYILRNPHAAYEITVGTDSQNSDKTKMVEVIVIHRIGNGAIFFYRSEWVGLIHSLRQKIQEETQRSLTIADGLLESVEEKLMEHDVCLDDMEVHFRIHCDVGYYGKTKDLIQEIVGWVQSLGYECCIKPGSYAASTVADKYSK